MNLYSNKQKWKIALLVIALVMVGVSLFVSNTIVTKVGERERERARQWADAIKKKIELVRLTNNTFDKLRDNERKNMRLWVDATIEVSSGAPLDAPLDNIAVKIVSENNEIPVILLDNFGGVSGRNLGFDTTDLRPIYPDYTKRQLMDAYKDSVLHLSDTWKQKNEPIGPIEVYEGIENTFIYNDSWEIVRLEKERDSLIEAFNTDLINNKALVPVLLIDEETKEVIGTNMEAKTFEKKEMSIILGELAVQNNPIKVDFNNGQKSILYFDDSPELKQLQFFPYIQFLVIGLFALIGYLIFSTFRKAEQNQVWAGMAKETAHQLGTPLSSLMAWVQLLESKGVDKITTEEMQKDIDRLHTVTDRFSKIGSGALLENDDISGTIQNVTTYLRPRISEKVDMHITVEGGIKAKHNASLIEWVLENICKNAVDAMEGEGELYVSLTDLSTEVHIDIKDTGKGIPSNQLKTIFQPGFSTKKRGWGLGLSLVKRIVKEYHKGRVFVLESQVDLGTTFRIIIPK
jgi:signal transduction histidine kinase